MFIFLLLLCQSMFFVIKILNPLLLDYFHWLWIRGPMMRELSVQHHVKAKASFGFNKVACSADASWYTDE